ncbi:unnamed protein product [Agarophyton chilense]
MGQQRRDALEVAFGDATQSDEEEFMFRPPDIAPQVSDEDECTARRKFTWKGVVTHLGPAFLVSIGYLDPGNWATDIEGGSKFGYKLLWVLILANFMALLLQVLAARMGIVTRAHLAELCRDEYPRYATYALWTMAELAIIATDLTEVLGTAIGINLLFNLPLMVGVVFTALDTFLLLTAQSQGMRRIEQLIFMFLALISFCFVLELFMSKPSISGVLGGIFVPRLDTSSLYVATGIVGATVMPHNFYLHSALVIERVPDRSRETLESECRYNLIDTAIALNAALFINCAILIIAAANFWTRGIEVTTLSKAYHLLENTGFKVGKVEVAPLLFGVALIASGQSSTLCGTLAGQYVMEGFLDLRAPPVIRRLVTRLIAIVPALIVISIMGDSGTYQLLIFCQVILSLQLPFAIVPMIRFTNSTRRMDEFKNSKSVSVLAWAAAGITVCLNVAFVFHSIIQGIKSSHLALRLLSLACVAPIFVALMIFLGWIAFRTETGGSGPVYRVEDEYEFVSEDGLDLDSMGSPVGSIPTPSPKPVSLQIETGVHPELDETIDLYGTDTTSRKRQLQPSQ